MISRANYLSTSDAYTLAKCVHEKNPKGQSEPLIEYCSSLNKTANFIKKHLSNVEELTSLKGLTTIANRLQNCEISGSQKICLSMHLRETLKRKLNKPSGLPRCDLSYLGVLQSVPTVERKTLLTNCSEPSLRFGWSLSANKRELGCAPREKCAQAFVKRNFDISQRPPRFPLSSSSQRARARQKGAIFSGVSAKALLNYGSRIFERSDCTSAELRAKTWLLRIISQKELTQDHQVYLKVIQELIDQLVCALDSPKFAPYRTVLLEILCVSGPLYLRGTNREIRGFFSLVNTIFVEQVNLASEKFGNKIYRSSIFSQPLLVGIKEQLQNLFALARARARDAHILQNQCRRCDVYY